MGLDPPGYLGDGRAMRFAVDRGVQEDGGPAWREKGIRLEVSCLRREEERLNGGNNRAQAKVGIEEGLTNQVCAVERGWGWKEVGSGKTGSEAGSSNGKRGSGK
jgi:hypothetical protein